jgi:predicted  nucleic acid-binding Zn-ribbon protein
VSQEPIQVEVNTSNDNSPLEGLFKGVWERTRATSELIHQLRDEKQKITQRIAELDIEMQKLRTAFANQELELKRLRSEHAELLNSNGDNVLSPDERERLKSKVRDLIAKINSHL